MGASLRRGRVVQVSVVAVVVMAAAVLGIGAPASAAVTLSATPSTNLIDGQSVQVTMSGLPANFPSAGIIQCVGVPASNTCDSSSVMWAGADGSGNASQPYTVSAMLSTTAHGVVDCRTPPPGLDCVLAGGMDLDNLGVQALTFDPVGPLRPPPTLTASPSTGLVDDQSLAVAGAGFVPGLDLYVLQCEAGAVDLYRCRTASTQPILAGGDGTIAGSVVVRAQFVTGTELIDCQAAPGACELRIPGNAPHLAAVAALSFDPLAPPTPMPVMTVTPAAGLVDLQTVTVSGTGFATSFAPFPTQDIPPVLISQCLVGTPWTCVSVGYTVPDATGAITAAVDVQAAMYSFADQSVHDCRPVPGTCRLVAVSYGDEDVAAFADLAFDPSAPLAPPPSLASSPNTGLIDGQIVDLTGTNFVADGFSTSVPITMPVAPDQDLPLRWNDRLGGFTPDVGAIRSVGDVAPEKMDVPGYTTVLQCVSGMTGWSGCDSGSGVAVLFDGAGNLSGRLQVHAVITIYGSGGPVSHDCRVEACELRAGAVGNPLREAVAPIAFDPAGPLLPPASITVEPAVDLVDGQLVTVRGEHFWWNANGSGADLVECPAAPPGYVGCSVATWLGTVAVQEDGSFTTTVRVVNGLGGTDCRTAPGACRIVAYGPGSGDAPPDADLGFDPNAPLLPLPEAAVSPSTNLAVGQQVTVTGRWFTSADTVEVVQCADRWLLTPVACDDATAVTTTTDDLGRAAATFTLQRSLTLRDGTAVDCTVEDCAVLVRNPDVFGEVAWVPIGMLAPTASGPTAPPPAVVSPNFAG